MARFHYGIQCDDEKKARKLWQFIAGLNIQQDGLDLSEDRVSVVSSQALLDEIRRYAPTQAGALMVEVWPEDIEYDDAESSGQLQAQELAGKPVRAPSGPSRFKTYAGSRKGVEDFEAWLTGLTDGRIEIIDRWQPQVEAGSYGIEFRCDDAKFDKVANKAWVARGVVTEKLKR